MANFNPQNTSLIVIDVQKYFIPGFPGAISPADSGPGRGWQAGQRSLPHRSGEEARSEHVCHL